MDKKVSLIEVIKEKPIHILGWTIGWSFVIGKVIEFIINWLLDLSYPGYGPRTIIPITIFKPVIFVVVGIFVIKHFRKKQSRLLQAGADTTYNVMKKDRPEYYGNYTWKDIFLDREVFAFYVILVFALWYMLDYTVRFISTLSTNYAISSLERTSMESLLFISIVVAALLVVWLQNNVISWLSKTQKGNKVLSLVVLVLGVMTFIAMLGLSYLWEDTASLQESLRLDFVLGEILPVDPTTTLWAFITGWFWNKARKCSCVDKKVINKGLLIAVVAFVISLTPLQTAIQLLWVAIGGNLR